VNFRAPRTGESSQYLNEGCGRKGEGCVREKEVYSVLLTLDALAAQPSSMMAAAVEVAAGPSVVAEATEAERAARLEAALLARCDSTPVAAASPITAADRSATMHDRMKTSRLQPQMARPAIDLGSSGWAAAGWACELNGEETV
jgi:hypothetical protein